MKNNNNNIFFFFILILISLNIIFMFSFYKNNYQNINNIVNNNYILYNVSENKIFKIFKNYDKITLNNLEFNMPYQDKYIQKNWETNHLKEFELLESQCLVTFGEWIGPIALYWNELCLKRNIICNIIAFEPDPIAFSKLSINVLSYSNIKIFNFCISKNIYKTKITVQGNSGSKINQGDYDVYCLNYQELYNEYPNCIYKIDVEGYEQELITELLIKIPEILSLSVHEPYISGKLFYENLNILKNKYNYVKQINDHASGFYEIFFKDKK